MAYSLTFGQYQKALEEGKYIGLKCGSCGAVMFPPKGVCNHCGGTNLQPKDIIRKGVIKTFTVIRVAPEGKKPPYIIVMVELEEGPCVLGNLEGLSLEAADFSLIGKKVKLGNKLVQGDMYSKESRMLAFELITG